MPNYQLLPETPLDPIMRSMREFRELQAVRPDAVNTTIGVMMEPDGQRIWRPTTVDEAIDRSRQKIWDNADFGYQSQRGDELFLKEMRRMVLGPIGSSADVLSWQTLGGTGALALAAMAFGGNRDKHLPGLLPPDSDHNYIPVVTDYGWPNHENIFEGALHLRKYARTSDKNRNQQGFIELVDTATPNTMALVQACGYNDDGLDRTPAEWDEFFDASSSKYAEPLPVLIDAAYLGLADGIEADRYAIETSISRGLLTIVAASASKNMGLYGERVGALFVINAEKHLSPKGRDHLAGFLDQKFVRAMFSSTPKLVAHAVGIMLADDKLRNDYYAELTENQQQLLARRRSIAEALGSNVTQVVNGRGLFTKVTDKPLDGDQLAALRKDGISALASGRVNIGGIALGEAERVGDAFRHVLEMAV